MSQEAPPTKIKPRRFKHECYVVAVGGFFSAYNGEWTENPVFAFKFKGPKTAHGHAQDVKARSAEALDSVRVMKCKMTLIVEDIEL